MPVEGAAGAQRDGTQGAVLSSGRLCSGHCQSSLSMPWSSISSLHSHVERRKGIAGTAVRAIQRISYQKPFGADFDSFILAFVIWLLNLNCAGVTSPDKVIIILLKNLLWHSLHDSLIQNTAVALCNLNGKC